MTYVHLILEWEQIRPNNLFNQTIIIMKDTSTAQINQVVSLLNSGHTGYQISIQTGLSTATISRIHSKHCSNLPKSSGGHPSKLSENNIHYATWLIGSGKVENAVQVAKPL